MRLRFPRQGSRMVKNGGRRVAVASKTESLRWLEGLKKANRLTAHEEKRKEEVLDVFRGLYRISERRLQPPRFPPWQSPW
jgi:hypothetical protein